MSLNTNLSTRITSPVDPDKIFDIFDPVQFGVAETAPDGVQRVKLKYGQYRIHNSMTFPKFWVDEISGATTFEIVELLAVRTDLDFNIDGDDDAHFWGRNVGILLLKDSNYIDISVSGSKLLDLVGASSLSGLIFDFTGIIGFKRIGEIVNMLSETKPTFWIDCLGGLVTRSSIVGISHTMSFSIISESGAVTPTKPMVAYMGSSSPSIQIVGCSLFANPNEAFYLIDSAANGTYSFTGNGYAGAAGGDFFQADQSALITARTLNNLTIDSFADSTVNPGVDTTVNFLTRPDVTIGQTIKINSVAPYDGTFVIQRVSSDELSFDIAVVFSGTVAAFMARVLLDITAHPFVRDQTIVIDAGSYAGTHSILRESDNQIEIASGDLGVVFGNATSTSQNQKSLGVIATANGAQADSTVSGETKMTGNTLDTTNPSPRSILLVQTNSNFVPCCEERVFMDTNGDAQVLDSAPTILRLDGNISVLPASGSGTAISAMFVREKAGDRPITFTDVGDLINETATPRVDGDTIVFDDEIASGMPTGLSIDIVYFVVTATANSFQVAYEAGGGAITFTGEPTDVVYRTADVVGSQPNLITQTALNLVPQALADVEQGDIIRLAVSNDGVANISVPNAYFRVAK